MHGAQVLGPIIASLHVVTAHVTCRLTARLSPWRSSFPSSTFESIARLSIRLSYQCDLILAETLRDLQVSVVCIVFPRLVLYCSVLTVWFHVCFALQHAAEDSMTARHLAATEPTLPVSCPWLDLIDLCPIRPTNMKHGSFACGCGRAVVIGCLHEVVVDG